MGNCSSSPVDGCSSSQTILKLSEFTADVELKLGELIVKKGEIVVDIQNCNTNNNNLFEEIIDKFTTFKNNSAACCEALQDALDDIIEELDDITGNTPVTTEEPTP